MPTHRGPFTRPHGPQHKNFPPRSYADLRAADIKLLAPILASAPSRDSAAYQVYVETTQQLISDLPVHLRSRHAWLTSFCPQHSKLNPLPIASLWNAITHEVDRELNTTWSHMSLIPAQRHFISRLKQHPWHSQLSDYAACGLQQLADDCDLLVALGASTLATLRPGNWKNSKRVLLFERLMAGRNSPSHAEGTVQKMYELADQLYMLRETVQRTDMRGQHIVGPSAEIISASTPPPSRPYRSLSQDDHVDVTVTALCQDVKLTDCRETGTKATRIQNAKLSPPVPSFMNLRKPVPARAQTGVLGYAFCHADMQSTTVLDVASSIYSDQNATSGSNLDAEDSTGSVSDTSEILELYRHSVWPPLKIKSTPISSVPGTRRCTIEGARYSTPKLAPIITTLGDYSVESSALRTSVLWKRRMEHQHL